MADIHISLMLRRLVRVVAQQNDFPGGIRVQLKRLQQILERLSAPSVDAEANQEKDEVTKLRLRWIKDAIYDADDVMDELSYEAMRQNEEGDYSSKHKVLSFVSSSNSRAYSVKMARNIEELNQNLDEISEITRRFGCKFGFRTNAQGITGQRSRYTTSFLHELEIVGREDDKSKIINLLTAVIPSSSSDISVISLVGMAELGKTTLAQLVYNDELVKKHFDLRMWVYVSDDFDIGSIFTQIMESSTKLKANTEFYSMEVLRRQVKDQLYGKKYLLVLDDIWNENALDWNKFISRLHVGVQGSKILVTTRSDIVASVVGVGAGSIVYGLKPLPDDACWSIIEKKAFSSDRAQNTQAMIKIGKEIAKKCGGLPVVAKSLGNLLHSRCTESDWVSIRDGSGQITHGGKNRIQSALKVSYNNLSPNLRECFSFCSIFPKNWEISKKTLIQLWMAEGFLEAFSENDQHSIEDIGAKFFHSLVSRSFFHYLEKNELGDIKTCKMHDSLHSLARDVHGDVELASLMVSELKDVSEARRLQLKLDQDISASVSENLSNGTKLRTIFIPEASNLDPAIFSGSKHLRVLHVGRSPDPGLTKLPHLNIKLIHLRYLYLSSLDLSEVVNDQSINKLYHLQTLVLTNMSGVQNLLTDIHSLKQLRHLEVSFTDMEVLPDSVTSLPNLQSLDLNNCKLETFPPDSITGLSSLTFLDMSFNPFEELPAFTLTLSNLQTLDICSCNNLKALPESVSGLKNLSIFNFKNCTLLEAVPQDLGTLTDLRSLDLGGTEIKVLPESCANLSKLELVHLYKCELPKEEEKWRYLRNLLGRGEMSSTSQEASTSR